MNLKKLDILFEKYLKKKQKGQLLITGLIYMFVEIIIFVTIYPIQQSFILNITNDPNTNPGLKLVLLAIPLLEGLAILVTPIAYIMISRSPGYGQQY